MGILKTSILLELVLIPTALSLIQLSHKLVYTEELDEETYGPFVNTNGLGVVYFFKTGEVLLRCDALCVVTMKSRKCVPD